MQTKKSHKANLERKRGVHFITGIVVSLSLILISFEWTRPVDLKKDLAESVEIAFDDDIIYIPRENKPKPPVKPELPKIIEILIITEDPVMDEFNPTWEPVPGEGYNFPHPLPDEAEIIDDDTTPFIVEIMPGFDHDGGTNGFLKFISDNMVYPREAVENGIEGKVYVNFTINENGELVKAKIFRGVHPVLDKEALRVIQLSPRWTPGQQGGKLIAVQFIFPINFVLQ